MMHNNGLIQNGMSDHVKEPGADAGRASRLAKVANGNVHWRARVGSDFVMSNFSSLCGLLKDPSFQCMQLLQDLCHKMLHVVTMWPYHDPALFRKESRMSAEQQA